MRSIKEHDTLAKRLGIILTRLNTGERLCLEELRREFGVSERTLQRDFNERLNYLPIQREGACYFLDPKVLGKQTSHEISTLLANMGLDTLFSGKHYLSNGVLNNKSTPPFLFKNPRIEDISENASMFQKLIESVQLRHVISFVCDGQAYDQFHPYRLVNDRGLWYLAGAHRNRLDLLRVARISELVRYEDKYSPDTNVEQIITGWRSDVELITPVDVVIQIRGRIADAFFNESTDHDFRVLKVLDSGDVLACNQTNNIPHLLRQLKAWLPDAEVLSPDWLRYQLKQELQIYLNTVM
ncbi:helix-turn-helix transcriptional regulator [Vibrio alginolyticus]|uniref:helix-turn-helix transcriptional regulator n=1 Tax=Vibrio alginolyticus TaxID=663 RepID=UPI001EED02FB|nr:WYL domain-containing protein [Vibrio alginolyticus]